jgi:peptidoglycan hydrolase-like protein with peptidoglycan-binding domain
VVQLASELNTAAFKARVAALKAAGQVPAGALAADSAKSCKIFTSQVNTLVLYAGPYAGPYDGCAARLAGPADAYIKGSNPSSAQQYISCLCPVAAAGIPQYSTVGQQGVWIGELQRVLGNRLNIDIPDLAGNWGTYTAGTKEAVKKFQRNAKLPANGVINSRTWQALHDSSC